MQLTEEQLQAAKNGQAVGLRIGDQAFVLLSREVYDRVSRVVQDDSPGPLATARMIRIDTAEDDAGDPTLDSYQQYKRHQ